MNETNADETDFGSCGICGYRFKAVEVCPKCGNFGLVVLPSEQEES